MVLQKATVNDHEILTVITKKSKAYWGYSDAQIEIWLDALTITKAYVEVNQVYKLVIDTEIIGYYAFIHESGQAIKLDNLFVLPEYIGKGFGRLLMDDFLARIPYTGAKMVVLESEPNAENFYAKFGFVKTGRVETSITGRYLPVMLLSL